MKTLNLAINLHFHPHGNHMVDVAGPHFEIPDVGLAS